MDAALVTLIVFTAINGYWTWQGKKVSNYQDVIKALQIQLKLKEEAVQEMLEKKNQMKSQYHHLLRRAEKAEAELATYKKFHNHET